MDKLIEYLEFINAISQIRHAAFVVGEESDHVGLKAEIDFGVHDPDSSDSRSIHTTSLNYALLTEPCCSLGRRTSRYGWDVAALCFGGCMRNYI